MARGDRPTLFQCLFSVMPSDRAKLIDTLLLLGHSPAVTVPRSVCAEDLNAGITMKLALQGFIGSHRNYPYAPVDAAGTTLAYIDSGPPACDSYTTVVLIHGHSYTAQTFSRILTLASSHNLRIIAPNRRDYVNSTPLSASELALLFSHDSADHKQFLRARGLEIARFLAWIIDELKIPSAESESSDGSKGGLALAGWSLGSVTTLAFLRHLPSFPEELVKKLEPYLKTFIIYESAYATLGYPYPQGAYHPLRDVSIPAHERRAAFHAWLSSYYIHPYFISSSVLPKPSRTLEQLSFRSPGIEVDSTTTNVFKLPSHANIDAEAFAATVYAPAQLSDIAFHGTVQAETLYDQLSGALFLSSSSSSATSVSAESKKREASAQEQITLSELRVLYIYGTRSLWTTQWGVWALEADLASRPEGTMRPVEFIRVEGTNHFWHWDEPTTFLALLAEKSGRRIR